MAVGALVRREPIIVRGRVRVTATTERPGVLLLELRRVGPAMAVAAAQVVLVGVRPACLTSVVEDDALRSRGGMAGGAAALDRIEAARVRIGLGRSGGDRGEDDQRRDELQNR